MVINSQLFEAYLKCATKCYLKATGETGTGNAYSEWLKTQNEAYRIEGVKHLTTEATQDGCISSPIELNNLRTAKWRLAINFVAGAQNLESTIHAVERVSSRGKGKPAQFIPVRFVFTNKITKSDKLLLAFDAFVLSKSLGRTQKINLGKIIHGDKHNELKVKVSSLASGVEKSIEKILKFFSTELPPDFMLNKHCSECEFQEQCRKKAIEKDELSLLAGLSEKEKKKLNNKGIFTITQLSYTFRPRRRPRRLKNKPEKYHHSLKALAVRKKKIHIVGSFALKIKGTTVYLDVEGLPDKDFYYLIGMRIISAESTMHHSLWADNEADEKNIWNKFLCILSNVENPVLICYGSYEKVFLKVMCERYGEPQNEPALNKAIKSPLNILSFIYGQVYFPTFSNGLKEIAGYFGYTWTDSAATGVQTVGWRQRWAEDKDSMEKQSLIIYNSEDCEALELVTQKLIELQKDRAERDDSDNDEVVDITLMKREHPYGFKRNTFFFPELDTINKAAYWDHQREQVYLKTNRQIKLAITRKPQITNSLRPNKQEQFQPPLPLRCIKCNSTETRKHDRYNKIIVDLKFTSSGVKRWIVQYKCYRWICKNCGYVFLPKQKTWTQKSKLGFGVMAYAVYQNIGLRLPQESVDHEFQKLFGLPFTIGTTGRLKEMAAKYYMATYEGLLLKLRSGLLIHADETKISLKNKVGFVWVFANMEEVAYVFSETREANVLQECIKDFKGVLVSDFYAAYDGINCPQQKCLVHLLRDLNDELLKHPYDEELKKLVRGFATLVQPMIATVDRYGLKSHFLKKHIVCVNRFYRELFKMKLSSELALKCKKRFEKNRTGLFTFLEHDGVPWNNNNAEHAVKAFATLRHVIKGVTSEKGLKDYLILLSICETCKYKGLDFLDFLRSGEKDIDVFAQRKAKRKMASPMG